MAEVTYKQCKLHRTAELNGNLLSTVTHIPSKLATVGRMIELCDKEGTWETWQVASFAHKEISEAQAKKIAKKHHAASLWKSK